jgi:hypothetical protein
VDLVLFALSLAGLAGVSAWLCRWRRRAGAAVLAGGAALVLAAGSISYLAHDGRMETNHMAKQTKSSAQAKAKPRAAALPDREQYRPPAGMKGAELVAFKADLMRRLTGGK